MNARIFGAVSVIAVGIMTVLPLRISRHWDAGCRPTAIMGGIVFGILMAYAIASSIGIGMQNRSQLAGSVETLGAQLKDQVADRDQAAGRLKSLAEDLPASAVAAKIESAKKDRRWGQTEGCTNVTATASRDFCQGIDRLRGQFDIAAEAAVLSPKSNPAVTSRTLIAWRISMLTSIWGPGDEAWTPRTYSLRSVE